MAVAVVERFKQESMYGLSVGTKKKKWRLSEVAVSGGSVQFSSFHFMFYLKDIQKTRKS